MEQDGMEKEKNIYIIEVQYLKENISKEKGGMEKEKNIIGMMTIMNLNLLVNT